MRIVHVTDCYLPRLGGIETQVADLVRHQSAAGHDVHVLTRTADTPNTADTADTSTYVHRIRAGWFHETILGSARTLHTVDELRPDVVHCHNSALSPLAVAVAGAASDLGIPTAMTVHSLLPSVGPLMPLSGTLLGMRGTCIAFSAVSEVAAALVRRVLGSKARVDILPNAVDVGWWRDAAGSPRTARPREVRVVTVGRLAIRKRPLALVALMAQVRDLVSADIPVRLIVVGDGPQRARIERRVRVLGMRDWVDLPGQLTRSEIRDLLSAADIYAAPAVLESFGIAALEARSVGLPVVAKAHGGVGEFVTDGTEGFLATTDRDMARALARLIESPSLRASIRAHNCAVAPAFGWDEALARTDELYARAADQAGRSAGLVGPAPVLPAAELQAAR
jgi:glycosyltransferase involved in cell wall biosynthesis